MSVLCDRLSAGGFHARPIRSARPRPSFRARGKAPADRIRVNVLNNLMDRLGFVDIMVPSCSSLPEAIIAPILVHDGESFQEFGRVRTQISDCLGANRLLQRSQNRAGTTGWVAGKNKNVNVFRHNYPRPEIELMLCSRLSKRLDEPSTGSRLAQQRQTVVTGERQKMSMSDDIVMLHLFSMRP